MQGLLHWPEQGLPLPTDPLMRPSCLLNAGRVHISLSRCAAAVTAGGGLSACVYSGWGLYSGVVLVYNARPGHPMTCCSTAPDAVLCQS